MKKRALNKDFLMEVKNSMNRFLSILLIATLGVAFFSGLQSSAPDMRITEDSYFDESNLMDIRVISTLGLTADDLKAISDVDGVADVQGSYMEDVYCDDGETETVLHVEAFTDSMNLVSVTEGSLPSRAGECFLDAYYAESREYHPGDKLEITVSDEENTYLKRTTFTIAGIGYSPCYIALTRGSTTLGTGSLSGFVYVLPQDFDADIYSVAYVQVEGAIDELTYSDAYDDLVGEVLEKIEGIADVRTEVRYKEVTGEAQSEIDEAKQEVEDGRAELEDAKAELEDARAEAESELEDAEAELLDGETQLEEGRQELEDAKAEVEVAFSQLYEGEAEVSSSEQSLASAQSQIASALNTLNAGEKEYQSGLSEYQSESEAAEKQLKSAQAQIDSGTKQLEEGWNEYYEGLSEAESGQSQIEDAEQQLSSASAALSLQQSSYNSDRASLDAAWEDYNADAAKYEKMLGDYETAQADVDSREAEYNNLKKAEESAQAAYDEAEALVSSLNSEVKSLNEQIASLEAQIAAEESSGSMTDDTEDSGGNEELNRMKEQLLAAQSSLLAAQAALSEAEAQASSASEHLDSSSAAAAAAGSELTQAQADLSAKKTELDTSLAGLEAAKQQLDIKESSLAVSAAAINAASLEISAARQELSEKKAELSAAEADLSAAKKTLEDTQSSLDAAQKEVDAGYAELASASAMLSASRKELDDGWSQYYSSLSQYNSGREQLSAGRQQLAGARSQIADALAQIEEAEAEIEENEQKIANGWDEYEEGKADAEQEIEDAEQEIADAEEEIEEAEQEIADAEEALASLSYPTWYVYDRSSLPDNTGYGENADRIASIAQVFPVLFFLIAALISLTTMSRMVEEERTQIGTLKALGYGKLDIARKYLEYAFLATLIGSVIGIAIGEKIIPWIIVNAYGIMYLYVPKILVPYNLPVGILAAVVAMACTIGASFYSCYRSLSAVPSELMRPPAPKEGKRVFLEHIPIIWNRLNFNWKSTVRNLLRYKSRFFMTIFGIGGCMGLLLVGFGLRDSIMDIGVLQYNEIQTFEAMVVIDTGASDEAIDELEQTIADDLRITESKYFYMQNLNIAQRDASGSGKQWTIYVYVPDNLDNIDDFLTLRSRTSGEEYTLNDDGAIITEKIAKEFGLSVGDSILLNKDDDTVVEVPISAICENYLTHYIYMTPALYEKTFGKEPELNCIFLCSDEDQDGLDQVGTKLLACEAALNITYMASLASEIEDMLGALDLVILVLIVSAGLLAFVVLYNLNNININERKRELATLKVLGCYDREVSAYIFRENILLTVIGAIAGCLIGKVMHGFIVTTVEVDSTMFGRTIYPISYVYGILFTFVFAVIVNLWMHFKMKKIDMIESLKSIE